MGCLLRARFLLGPREARKIFQKEKEDRGVWHQARPATASPLILEISHRYVRALIVSSCNAFWKQIRLKFILDSRDKLGCGCCCGQIKSRESKLWYLFKVDSWRCI